MSRIESLVAPGEEVSLVGTGIRRVYGGRLGRHVALDDVDLTVHSHSSIGIVGESGSGKSTLSRILCGLDAPDDGRVKLNGFSVPPLARSSVGNVALRRIVQYVPQDTSSSFDPRRTLRHAVQRPARTLLGLSPDEAHERADALFERLGLSSGLADRRPWQVSGGQRQRFSLARALIVEPRILVCDEVVSALDVSVQGKILNLIKTLCAQMECGLLFVSHGLPATAFVADEMVVMYRGVVVERGPSAAIVRSPGHPYTRRLIDAYRVPRAS